MALGQSDFGLYGVVGGLTVFIAFFNGLLASAISRYYAYALGEATRAGVTADEGLENCRNWFNTALFIHSILPVFLVAVGYPIGLWAVRNYLSIPPERVSACVWVFRMVCASCFVGMVNIPFQAMYIAKQYIAELTIYSFAQTLANTLFFYYMATHPGDWLVRYAVWMSVVIIVPQIVICVRALFVFPECRIRLSSCIDGRRFRQLGSYAFWQMFGGVGVLCHGQGMAIVINKEFGAMVNAAMSIANQVGAQTQTLSAALHGAFQPAIVTACGAGDAQRMQSLAFRACKFSMLLALVFSLPLLLELPEVLRIWLRTPPPYTEGLCWCMLTLLFVENSTLGHMLAVNANGRIALYKICLGAGLMISLPLAFCFTQFGWGPNAVGVAMVIATSVCSYGRLWFAKYLVGMPIDIWVIKIMLPIFALIIIVLGGGISVRLFMEASFLRVVLTTIVCEMVFFPMTWFCVFDDDERQFVVDRIRSRLKGLRRRNQ